MNSTRLAEYKNNNGKVVAWLVPGTVLGQPLRILEKVVARAHHHLESPAGYGYDQAIIDQAIQDEVTTLRILERDTGSTWEAPLATFLAHAFRLDRGFGPQRVLEDRYWQNALQGQLL